MYNYSPYYDYDFGYGYDFMPESSASVVGGIILFAVVAIMVILMVSIVRYILEAFAFYNLAKRRNINNAFLAFIPVANSYILGAVHDDINKTMNKPTKNANKLLILKIVTIAVDFVSIPFLIISALVSSVTGIAVVMSVITSLFNAISLVLSIIYFVFSYISIYGIYKEYAHEHATLYLVLSIIFAPLRSVFLFLIRNKQSGYELWLKQREQQQRAAAETKFEEAVAETSVEEVFGDAPIQEEQEQTIIEQSEEEEPSTLIEIEPETFEEPQSAPEQTENE